MIQGALESVCVCYGTIEIIVIIITIIIFFLIFIIIIIMNDWMHVFINVGSHEFTVSIMVAAHVS